MGGRGKADQGQKRPFSPVRSQTSTRPRDDSPSQTDFSGAASDFEDRNLSEAESGSSHGSPVRASWKFVAEGKWVKSQWLSARCLSDQPAVDPTLDSGPSKALAFGRMSSEWHRISTNRIRRKWAHSTGAPSFSTPKADDSLTAAFDNVKVKSKASFNLMENTIQSAGAAAHAILTSKAFLHCFLNEIPKNPPSFEEWSRWRSELKDSFKSSVFSPISDATTCLASISNSCVKDVRRLVLATPQAKPLKVALKDSKPSASHYFGNNTEKVNSAISSAYMLKSLDDKQPRKFAPFAKKGSNFQSSRPSFGSKGSSFNKGGRPFKKTPARGNASSRPPRGKGAGKE